MPDGASHTTEAEDVIYDEDETLGEMPEHIEQMPDESLAGRASTSRASALSEEHSYAARRGGGSSFLPAWTLLQNAIAAFRIFAVEQGSDLSKRMRDLDRDRPIIKPVGPTFCFYNADMASHVWTGNTADGMWNNGQPHPEDPGRIQVIMNALSTDGLLARMEEVSTNRLLERCEAELIHGRRLWSKLENFCKKTPEQMREWNTWRRGKQNGASQDLYAHQSSFLCTRIGSGGVLELLSKIVTVGGSAMAIVRPPGRA